MRILFIGDIFGKPGREIAKRAIPALVERDGIDFVIANVENSAAGFGVTGDIADAILGYGVDVMTSGNHVWDKKEVLDYIPRQPKLLRPANFPAGAPGPRQLHRQDAHRRAGRRAQPDGAHLHAAARRSVRAWRCGDREPARARRASSSSTSTPRRRPRRSRWAGISTAGSTAVVGTHTHVQTADERILPKGTAYITDAGMTGPHDSIIGVTVDAALGRFVTGMPSKFEPAGGGARLNAVVVTADPRDRQGDRDRAPEPVRGRRRGARRIAGGDRTPLSRMSDLFSQPFEEDEPDRRPPPARRRAPRAYRQPS